mgnify:CR=1 FL=1
MKKRCFLAILLVLSLLLTILSGCGTEASVASAVPEPVVTPSEAPPVEAPTPTPEPEGSPEAPASTAEDSVLEPEEVLPEISYPLCDETQTLSLYCTAANFMGPLSSVSMTWDDFSYNKVLEELTNVHIDYQAVSFESYLTQFNVYIAAGDYADLLINVDTKYVGGVQSAYEDGVIVDIAPYLKDHAPDYYTMINSDDALKDSAYHHSDQVFEFIAAYDEPGVKNGNIVRGDWMEKLGLDEITTLDDMYTYLSGARNQFGASVPVYMTGTCSEMMTAYGLNSYGVGNGNLSFYVVDGEVRTSINQDAYKEYLTEMHKWYEEGLLYQDFATTYFDPHDNTMTQMIYNGQIAVWATQIEGLDDYAANATDPEFVSTPIPQITLDGSINHNVTVEYVINDSDITVSTNCDNVELAVEWMNYWYTEEGIRMYNYGPEGEAYHLDGDRVVLEDFVLNNEFGVDVSSYLRMYCPFGSFTGIYLRSRLMDYSSQLQLDAAEIWTSSNDGAYVMPNGVTVDAEANETLSSLAADIMTYADSCIPKFILGDMDIETEWDSYIATLESMGIAECVQIKQDAYDNYISN